MNSLTKKIITGTLAVLLISGTGFAFANTSAGEALKNWYDRMFNEAVEGSLDDVSDYEDEQYAGLEDDVEAAKSDAEASILKTRDDETEGSLSEIDKAKQAHLEALIAEKGEIDGYIEHQFYNVYMENWLDITATAEESAKQAGQELTAHTNEKGEESLQYVTNELTTATDNAVQSLEDEIEKAKEALEEELDGQQDNLTYNLKKEIDFSIASIQDTIKDLKKELVEEQQEIIVAKAQELENAAKESLDEVVENIDK